ncbi:hypothetical protein BT63DRAFT_426819 [Microthyrium microscopicum]|uniref:Extracellular serine-rich protein n=1 Tax=Microthyrium microscopicum TaxID=703497 RepID=A0A6A6U8P2_9PEZI|nr:hypothetical protein BT63DRAFT_426819 [Microthyrium microscopicum]
MVRLFKALAALFVSSVAAQTCTNATTGPRNVQQTVLVFSMDAYSTYTATSGLNAYGIPYQVVVVPQAGITLPTLNSSLLQGNYGSIVVMNELSYDYGGTVGWQSALTTDQWATLFAYQVDFGVRMVRINAYPTTEFGVQTVIDGQGCCNAGVEQLMYFTDTSAFPTAGLLTGATAGVSTLGNWHYPATITNTTLAKQVAAFGASTDNMFSAASTAAVINDFGNRQQMVFFIGWATDWSETSNFLQHSFIHWMTRGMYSGFRRVLFNTQIDDMHLTTQLYQSDINFRLSVADLNGIVAWQKNLQGRLPLGSNWTIEIGHNGNGDIDVSTNQYDTANPSNCNPDTAIYYDDQPDVTPATLEFVKPLGTGRTWWPSTPTSFQWTLKCALNDPMATWFNVAANRDQFMHISHTFTHLNLDNSTYADTSKEISWNVDWLKLVGIYNALHFSPNGIIPPAITGLHNGDAIQAWMDNGITRVVGDNTRPILTNPINEYWPLITNTTTNGHAGLVVMPRWSTTIFYDCNNQTCTTNEWIQTSAGAGGFTDLLAAAKNEHGRHVFALHQDPYMFHQANLMNENAPSFTVGSQTGKLSLMSIWTETILQEVYRLVNWPILTIKHDDLATVFLNRMARDQCGYNLAWQHDSTNTHIISAVLTSNGNTCSAPVPVTFPGPATASVASTAEQIGNDPLTLWVKLTGSPITFTLTTPIAI